MKTASITHDDCTDTYSNITTIKYDTLSRSPQQFACGGCQHVFYVQVQICVNCSEECVVADPQSFESGKYTCWNCHIVGLLCPWYPPKKPLIPKKNFLWECFKNLLKKKKGTLVHDAEHACPECGGNSLFLNVEASGTSAICADCTKQFKVSINASG